MAWGKYGITERNGAPADAYETWFNEMLDDEGRRKHLEGIPMRRMGDPEKDIGAPVAFLAGWPASSLQFDRL